MIATHTPLVLYVYCPMCGAAPGIVCKEFGLKLIAHLVRLEAAQTVFETTAKKLKGSVHV